MTSTPSSPDRRWLKRAVAVALLAGLALGLARAQVIVAPPEVLDDGAIVLAWGGSTYEAFDTLTGPCERHSLPVAFCTRLGLISVRDRTRVQWVLPWAEWPGRTLARMAG